MQTLFLITNSYDLTTDLILDRLHGESVFRFNFDHFSQYSLNVSKQGFVLSDVTGRSVDSRSIYKAYWRKPFNAPSEQEHARSCFVDAELRYVLSEMANHLWMTDRFVLVEPFAERRTGKLMQLEFAQNYFHTPGYALTLNSQPRKSRSVVKSLSNELVNDGVFYTTRVDTHALAPGYPWFVQDEVKARADVTVVFVRGKLFTFSLERNFLDRTVDWRQLISPTQVWDYMPTPKHLEEAILGYMEALRLDYGRLDFLLDDDDRYWFCEVNPNGQFAWLDLDDRYRLLSTVASEISTGTERFALTQRHPLAGAYDRLREEPVSSSSVPNDSGSSE